MFLVLLLVVWSGDMQIQGIEDGDTLVGNLSYSIENRWDLENFIGLEVTIQGQTVAYHSEPPFESEISLESFPSGNLEVRFVASFFGGKQVVKAIHIHHQKNVYVQTVHLIQIPITLDQVQGPPSPKLFHLKVGGTPQKIEKVWGRESPLDLVILLDTSGSMKERLPIMRLLIRQFLEQLEPEDRVKLIGFYHKVYEISEFSQDKKEVARHMLSIKAGGDTNLYGALWAGVKSLAKAERRRGILLLTDGRHQMEFAKDEAFQKNLEECIGLARKHMVPVFVLGIGHGTDPEVLERIANGTAGRYCQSVKKKKIEASFNLFLSDLRQQVVLGYYHQLETSGWTDIEVTYLGKKGKMLFSPSKVFIK